MIKNELKEEQGKDDLLFLFFLHLSPFLGNVSTSWIRLSNVASVGVGSVSAASADIEVFTDAAFAFEDSAVLEAVVVF